MLEILFLIVTTGGIAGYARGRGGNPWVSGALSVAGYVVVQFFGGIVVANFHLAENSDARLVLLALPFAWVGIIAICTRFVLGHGREKPSGMWSCSNCKYLNQHYVVVCEACKQPYGNFAKST